MKHRVYILAGDAPSMRPLHTMATVAPARGPMLVSRSRRVQSLFLGPDPPVDVAYRKLSHDDMQQWDRAETPTVVEVMGVGVGTCSYTLRYNGVLYYAVRILHPANPRADLDPDRPYIAVPAYANGRQRIMRVAYAIKAVWVPQNKAVILTEYGEEFDVPLSMIQYIDNRQMQKAFQRALKYSSALEAMFGFRRAPAPEFQLLELVKDDNGKTTMRKKSEAVSSLANTEQEQMMYNLIERQRQQQLMCYEQWVDANKPAPAPHRAFPVYPLPACTDVTFNELGAVPASSGASAAAAVSGGGVETVSTTVVKEKSTQNMGAAISGSAPAFASQHLQLQKLGRVRVA